MESIPQKYLTVYNFIVKVISKGDFCRLSNILIGKRTNLQPRTVGRHLTELERIGAIVRTQGAPEGAFEPGGEPIKGRRIYLGNHKDIQHLRPLELQKAPPPHPYTYTYPDIGHTGHLRKVRHDKTLSLLARFIYGEIVQITAGGDTHAPLAYYAWAIGCTEDEAMQALKELHDSGDIWLFKPGGNVLYYGTVAGLFENLANHALMANPTELQRLKQIVKDCTIYGSTSKMKKDYKPKAVCVV